MTELKSNRIQISWPPKTQKLTHKRGNEILWYLKSFGPVEDKSGRASTILYDGLQEKSQTFEKLGREGFGCLINQLSELQIVTINRNSKRTFLIGLTDSEGTPAGTNPFEEFLIVPAETTEATIVAYEQPKEETLVDSILDIESIEQNGFVVPETPELGWEQKIFMIMQLAGDVLLEAPKPDIALTGSIEELQQRLAVSLEDAQKLRNKLREAIETATAERHRADQLSKLNNMLNANIERLKSGKPVDESGYRALRNMMRPADYRTR